MLERLLKFIMMVAILIVVVALIRIYSILENINDGVKQNNILVSEIHNNLSGISIDAVILQTNE